MPARDDSKKAELIVVFDTNAIFTEAVAFILKREVTDVIAANSSHADLQITWLLPEIVRDEREYQMRENGVALLQSVQKFERVLGHQLNITEPIITSGVRRLIDEQLGAASVKLLSLDVGAVEWNRVIKDSAFRVPPFERGKTEKGFRDVIILESFLQLVAERPTTPRLCRIALVTADGLLTEAVTSRTKGAKNVRILANLEELKGLINTLVSAVDEEFIRSVQAQADTYFFEKGKPEALYVRENIGVAISTKFGKELAALPPGATGKEFKTAWIGTTRFSEKRGQRIHWITRVTFEYKTYRPAAVLPKAPSIGSGIPPQPSPKLEGLASLPRLRTEGVQLPSISQPPLSISEMLKSGVSLSSTSAATEREYGTNAQFVFDVSWSVRVTSARHRFSAATVDRIEFVESIWAPVESA